MMTRAKFWDRLRYLLGSPRDAARLLSALAGNRWRRLTAGWGPRRVRCNLCGWQGRRFDTFLERHFVTPGSQCPGCGSQRRHRELVAYLAEHLPPAGRRVLDVAPAARYREWFKASGADYLSIDFGERPAMARMDLCRLALPDAGFDLVICSHVLEHILDFGAGLREIARVLRPGGAAIIAVPFGDRPASRLLAAPDHQGHWHDFGRDFPVRIREAGLAVETRNYSPGRDAEDPDNIFFLARKPAPDSTGEALRSGSPTP